jgi:hypothetical protein
LLRRARPGQPPIRIVEIDRQVPADQRQGDRRGVPLRAV